MTRILTRTEFEQGYAKRSRVTVEWLKEQGLEAGPCDCDYDDCEGWRMNHVKEDEWFDRYMAELRK